MSNVSKLIIISIPDHKLRFAVIRLLSQRGYRFICAKNLPRLCHEITNLEEECLLIIDIFAYSSPIFKVINVLGADKKLKSVFLMDEEGMRHSQRFRNDGTWFGVEKKYLNEQLWLVMDQIHGKQTAQKEESQNNKREVYSMPEKGENLFSKAFGRRSFLKGTAAAAVTGVTVANPGNMVMKALAVESEESSKASEDKLFSGVCRGNCIGGCRLKITVRNGKVVKTTLGEMPDPRYNRICQKGITHLQRIYNANRIKYPMKRVGERGSGQWQQLTWDEAIEEICTNWKNIQQTHGKNAIAFSQGSGNIGLYLDNYPAKLQRLMGAANIDPSYDTHGLVSIAQMTGSSLCTNGNEPADLLNARCILIWGANPSEAQVQSWHFIVEAKKAGAKIVVIDPNFTVAAGKADLHLPIRPGTDAALAMGMINIVLEQGWEDTSFLKKSTVAPFLVKSSDGKFLRSSDLGPLAADAQDGYIVMDKNGAAGLEVDVADPVIHGSFTVNGVQVTTAYDLLLARCAQWTPEKVAELCNISVEDLREVVRLYAKNAPSTIFTAFGIDHYTNGLFGYYGCAALAAVTGNMGKAGAFCGATMPQPGVIMNFAALATPEAAPGPTIPAPMLLDVMNEKQYFGTPIELKSLYVFAHNPLANQTERKAWLEALRKMDLVVVADIQETDTTRYADIILPVTHWFETQFVYGANSPYMIYQEQAIDPLYEAKDDYAIVDLLAKGMGLESHFTETREEHFKTMLDTDGARAFGVTWEKLKQEKVLRGMPEDYVYGADGMFNTPSRRIEFYLESPAPLNGVVWDDKFDIDKIRMAYFEPPHEAWPETVAGYEKNSLADKYPLIYTTERNKMKVHTQFGHNPWLLELYPEPIVKINPQDAAVRGVSEGDYVRVYNDRGYVVLKAVIHAGARPGVLIVPKGWEWDQFKDGHYSDLTSRVMNMAIPNNSFFDCLVELKKA
ncbi:molybdopterin-containing oxidoreductase family protein [Syntrophomonas curvata]